MKQLGTFVKTTLTGGLLVLFPLFGFAYLIVLIGSVLTSFMKPLLSFLPRGRFVGVAADDVASVFVLLLLCFLIGLIVRTSVGNALQLRISRALSRIPLYRMFGRIARTFLDQEDPRGSPVLVQQGQTKQIGFMVAENSAEEFTVFFPSAPTVFSGNIVIVEASTVEKLNVPTGDVVRVIATFGAGMGKILAEHQSKNG